MLTRTVTNDRLLDFFTTAELALILHLTPAQTAQSVTSPNTAPAHIRERFTYLHTLIETLETVLSPSDIVTWLNTAQPELFDAQPMDVFEPGWNATTPTQVTLLHLATNATPRTVVDAPPVSPCTCDLVHMTAMVLAKKYSTPLKANPDFSPRLWWKNLTVEEKTHYLEPENTDEYNTVMRQEFIVKTEEELVNEPCSETFTDTDDSPSIRMLTYQQVARTLLSDRGWLQHVRTHNAGIVENFDERVV